MDTFGSSIILIGGIVLFVYLFFMGFAPLTRELVPETVFDTCGTYEYNDKIYRIAVDTLLSDSLYKTKNWR